MRSAVNVESNTCQKVRFFGEEEHRRGSDVCLGRIASEWVSARGSLEYLDRRSTVTLADFPVEN